MAKRRDFYTIADEIVKEYNLSTNKAPILEAMYNMDVKIFKSDRKNAVPSDPHSCIIAIGMMRLPNVIDAFVGQGKDAYLILLINGKVFAWHFVISTSARKVLDDFDTKGSAKTQTVTLRVPTKALKLAYRRKSNAKRRLEIKLGTGKPVTPRKPRRAARMDRLVHNTTHRERPPIRTEVVS